MVETVPPARMDLQAAKLGSAPWQACSQRRQDSAQMRQ